ncbi:MAG: hypothetical protein N3A38_16430, partial [Planctomycetota bacterium]|nr:hypothetical protein [Planctomycetota bacterium]
SDLLHRRLEAGTVAWGIEGPLAGGPALKAHPPRLDDVARAALFGKDGQIPAAAAAAFFAATWGRDREGLAAATRLLELAGGRRLLTGEDASVKGLDGRPANALLFDESFAHVLSDLKAMAAAGAGTAEMLDRFVRAAPTTGDSAGGDRPK